MGTDVVVSSRLVVALVIASVVELNSDDVLVASLITSLVISEV